MSLEKQAVLIRVRWHGKVTTAKDELTWVGHLRPTDVSPDYTVRLRYQLWHRPRVTILEPLLDPGHREALPHVYAADDICLYSTGDWGVTKPIATTIIPWVAEWLFHYEAWRATELWSGGGDPYAPKQPANVERKPAGPPAIWSR